jgi:hypothetical protein
VYKRWCIHLFTSVLTFLSNSCSTMSKCPLWQAVHKGDVPSSLHLFTSVLTFLNKCRDSGTSPLFIACQNGHDKIVEILLTHGADINKSRDDYISPLQIACYNNHIYVVEEFCCSIMSRISLKPFSWATVKGEWPFVLYLWGSAWCSKSILAIQWYITFIYCLPGRTFRHCTTTIRQ